jgi:hypothetical protein
MRLFSKIFGGKKKSSYEHPQLGVFTLVYSKGGRNLWTSSGQGVTLTACGSEHEPFKEHLRFLEKAGQEIEGLHEAISRRFIYEFEEAGLETGFASWKEKFRIADIAVEDIVEGEPFWIVIFEQLEEPYAHFNLHLEGREPNEFSIDT